MILPIFGWNMFPNDLIQLQFRNIIYYDTFQFEKLLQFLMLLQRSICINRRAKLKVEEN